jgi:osmoprotectant transport system ATP-binding protein
MPQIVLEDVSKLYGADTALAGVSLAFEDGVTTAVVGRSGGGKSTMLQLINGLVRPDRGGIRVFGQPIDYSALPRLRRRIGYAVQGTGLFPHMTVRANITLLARLEGWPRQRAHERCDQLMDLVELPTDYCGRYPHELSGGEQQRVGLCRAMMLDPPVFLLDEPFGALDSITRGEIHREFIRLQRASARTIVMVTHDVREAVKLAQRLVVIEKGRALQHAPVREVLARPADDMVRDLLAAQLDGWEEGK